MNDRRHSLVAFHSVVTQCDCKFLGCTPDLLSGTDPFVIESCLEATAFARRIASKLFCECLAFDNARDY